MPSLPLLGFPGCAPIGNICRYHAREKYQFLWKRKLGSYWIQLLLFSTNNLPLRVCSAAAESPSNEQASRSGWGGQTPPKKLINIDEKMLPGSNKPIEIPALAGSGHAHLCRCSFSLRGSRRCRDRPGCRWGWGLGTWDTWDGDEELPRGVSNGQLSVCLPLAVYTCARIHRPWPSAC